MLGDLRVAAPSRLGERHDPLDARDRLTCGALEELVEDGPGLGPDVGQLDLHHPARVVPATDDARLLEHPDQDARIVIPGRQEGGVDDATLGANRPVDAPEVVGLGNVSDGEPTDGRRVGGACEEEGRARRAVAAPSADHLDVALERVGVVEQAHEPNVRLVDAHSERGRRDNAPDAAADEVLLHAGTLARLEAGVIMLHRDPVASKGACDPFAGVAGACVDDGAALVERAESVDEDAKPVLVAADLLDVVAEVRAHHARPHDLEVATERLGDAAGGRRGRGRRHPEDSRAVERLENPADEEVIGAEVVPPHAHAVHLVDHDEPDADRAERPDEGAASKALRRRIEQTCPACGDVVQPAYRLGRLEGRVDERGRGGDLCRKLVDLVLHQRDQG